MAKSDTILKYREQFLEGRSPEFIERFDSKSEARQYSSIMAWRHKSRCRERESASASEVVDYVRQTRQRIAYLPAVTEHEIAEIERELKALLGYCGELRRKVRDEEIRKLESQQNEIAEKLRRLKGEEPGLFDLPDEDEC